MSGNLPSPYCSCESFTAHFGCSSFFTKPELRNKPEWLSSFRIQNVVQSKEAEGNMVMVMHNSHIILNSSEILFGILDP